MEGTSSNWHWDTKKRASIGLLLNYFSHCWQLSKMFPLHLLLISVLFIVVVVHTNVFLQNHLLLLFLFYFITQGSWGWKEARAVNVKSPIRGESKWDHKDFFIYIFVTSHPPVHLLVLHEWEIPTIWTFQSFLQTFFCGKIFSVKWHIKGILSCFDSVKHP